MAAPQDAAGNERDDSNTEDGKPSLVKRLFSVEKLLSRKTLAVLLAASLAGHLAYPLLKREELKATESAGREVTLGDFFFASDGVGEGAIRRADFRLHVDLLKGTDEVTRRRLEQRRSMVQQNVEQLLRRARPVDFTDPILAELKRQLQEAVNETISLRGISDIIITDLVISRSSTEVAKPTVASHRQSARANSSEQPVTANQVAADTILP